MIGVDRTGASLLRILLNDSACRSDSTSNGGSFLLDSPYGIRAVLSGSDDAIAMRAEPHFGKIMQVLGELGVPASTAVSTSSGRVGTVTDLYRDMVMTYKSACEQPFVACALSYWHAPNRSWTNEFGEEFNFDELVQRLLAMPLGAGSCGGCHVPYAVVTILRIDEECSILTDTTRSQAHEWLKRLLGQLEAAWATNGCWDRSWATDGQVGFLYGNLLLDRLTITGHHLEWIALLPDSIRADEVVVSRAIRALRQDIDSLPPLSGQSFKTLLPVSHAARALSLMRGIDPFTFWTVCWKKHKLDRSPRGFEYRLLDTGSP